MKRDCIIITMPEKLFKDYPGGREALIKTFERVDQGLNSWWHIIASIPVQKVEFVYFCWDGYVQMRVTSDSFIHNKGNTTFTDGGKPRTFVNKKFAVCIAPVVMAPKNKFPQRGFRGFRYTEFLF